jgi:hypothetical protein
MSCRERVVLTPLLSAFVGLNSDLTKKGELALPASSPRHVMQSSLFCTRVSSTTRISERGGYWAIQIT